MTQSRRTGAPGSAVSPSSLEPADEPRLDESPFDISRFGKGEEYSKYGRRKTIKSKISTAHKLGKSPFRNYLICR